MNDSESPSVTGAKLRRSYFVTIESQREAIGDEQFICPVGVRPELQGPVARQDEDCFAVVLRLDGDFCDEHWDVPPLSEGDAVIPKGQVAEVDVQSQIPCDHAMSGRLAIVCELTYGTDQGGCTILSDTVPLSEGGEHALWRGLTVHKPTAPS